MASHAILNTHERNTHKGKMIDGHYSGWVKVLTHLHATKASTCVVNNYKKLTSNKFVNNYNTYENVKKLTTSFEH